MSASKKKYPKFTLRQKPGSSGIMTGANSELLLNGKRLPLVKEATVTVKAGGLAELQVTMLGSIEVEGKLHGHQIGSLLPVALKSNKSKKIK